MENQEQKEMREISSESVNAVLQYLSSKPYVEVYKIVPLLLNTQVIKPAVPAASAELPATTKENANS